MLGVAANGLSHTSFNYLAIVRNAVVSDTSPRTRITESELQAV